MAVMAAAAAASACRPATNPPAPPGTAPATTSAAVASQPTPVVSRELRIISLSPAISRTLIDFGLQAKIVGRTPHCTSLDKSIPSVGDLLNVNYEQIVRLAPTHILVQPPETGIDPHLQELASQHGWSIGQWHLNDCDDIKALVRELPAVLYAEGSPQRSEATQRAVEIINKIDAALAPGPDPLYPGRTLLVYSVRPVSVFGAGTYLDDVLKSFGGTNAIAASGWVELSLEDVVRLNPQAIIFIKPGASPGNAAIVAGELWDLDIEAVNMRRLAVLTNPDAFMPSSAVVGVADELRPSLKLFQAVAP